ncbi:erythromycin biosynthesis sensory transduction protein eryC1 [Bordetella genomosp. 8]|uniref:Erythromycin biosynthesis sensory transduction protein eryC1 n=2 Tax=Bordetella genomosp. 8 TaxID=1416806 RepID=A0A1W6YSL9_9BORD|nr:erythromycin biosynthesis sensory transduction protein eryC1 [Bordetella genomosp. 8]
MSGRIMVSDLHRQTSALRQDLLSAMTSVLDSAWFVHGKSCSEFEARFAEYCGTAHCVGVANGTDALEIGLRSMGVKSGSRVATVANAGFYTSTALLAIGAHPVYVDVDPHTMLMDLRQLSEVLDSTDLNAVVITHLYGLMHDMPAVRRLCDAKGVRVLEDCAQAHGAATTGGKAGSFGHAATFSFYPTKNLGAIGDGGAVVSNDADIAAGARTLRQYGWDKKYHVAHTGGRNSRLDEMQAAILAVKLAHLDTWNDRRRAIAGHYTDRIKNPRVTCPPLRGSEYVGHLYVVQCGDRDGLRAHLDKAGIATDIHYPLPDHQQAAVREHMRSVSLPVTEHLARRLMTIPLYPELTDPEIDRVVQAVNDW